MNKMKKALLCATSVCLLASTAFAEVGVTDNSIKLGQSAALRNQN